MTGMAMVYGGPPRIGRGRDAGDVKKRVEEAMAKSLAVPWKPKGDLTALPLRLKEARDARALTQEELGAIAKLKAAAISHFETGTRTPTLRNLLKLADALHTTPNKLLGFP